MINTELHPGETIPSLMARIKTLAINRQTKSLYQSLLGCSYTQTCGIATYRLNLLAAQLQTSVCHLIGKHTPYQYYTHFMNCEHKRRLKKALAGDNPEALECLTGAVTSRLGIPQYNAFCPHCADKDIELYGAPYWHQFHELPGVTACYMHGVKLIRCPLKPKHLAVPDFRSSEVIHASEQEILFAKLSAALLEKAPGRKTLISAVQTYRHQLDLAGYVTPRGMIRSSLLLKDIRQFWSDILQNPDFKNIRIDGSKQNFVRDVLKQVEKRTHPVKHILLAGFLEAFPPERVQKLPAAPSSKEAGNAELAISLLRQGVSLNKTSEQSGISYYSVRKLAHQHQISIKTKPGKLSPEQEAETLKLLDQGLPMKKIGEMVGLSESGVDNLLTAHPELRAKRQQLKKQNQEALRSDYRSKALQVISENPDLHRKALFEISSELFIWLRNNDKHWLNKHLPPPCSAKEAQSLRYKKQGAFWLKKQQVAIRQLQRFIRRAYQQPPSNQRISIAYILKTLKVRNTPAHIRKTMPMFWHQVNRVAETHEEFQLRKLYALYRLNPEYFQIYSVLRVLKFARSHPAVTEKVKIHVKRLQRGIVEQPAKTHLLIFKETSMAAPVRMIQSIMCAEAANSQTMLVTHRHVEFTYKKHGY